MKIFIGCLLLSFLTGCSTHLEKWAASHSLRHSAINSVKGSYENRRIGKMSPERGLWYLLTGEDTDVDTSVSLHIDGGFLIVRTKIDGQQRMKRIKAV